MVHIKKKNTLKKKKKRSGTEDRLFTPARSKALPLPGVCGHPRDSQGFTGPDKCC